MNIESSYSNVDNSNLEALFMNYFSVLNFNIQRFSSNFEELSINLVDLNLCAIRFTETWLTIATEPLYRLDSYNSFYNSRCFRAGGASCFDD